MQPSFSCKSYTNGAPCRVHQQCSFQTKMNSLTLQQREASCLWCVEWRLVGGLLVGEWRRLKDGGASRLCSSERWTVVIELERQELKERKAREKREKVSAGFYVSRIESLVEVHCTENERCDNCDVTKIHACAGIHMTFCINDVTKSSIWNASSLSSTLRDF